MGKRQVGPAAFSDIAKSLFVSQAGLPGLEPRPSVFAVPGMSKNQIGGKLGITEVDLKGKRVLMRCVVRPQLRQTQNMKLPCG